VAADPRAAAAARSTDAVATGSASRGCGSRAPPWAARSPVGGEDDEAARIRRRLYKIFYFFSFFLSEIFYSLCKYFFSFEIFLLIFLKFISNNFFSNFFFEGSSLP